MSKSSTFIPNSFQTPNAYVDQFMAFLSGEEYKVLSYAARRIFGFQRRTRRISLREFADGNFSPKDGRRLDHGTGVSVDAIQTALGELVKFNLMIEVDGNNKANDGACWALQLNSRKVDWTGLKQRREDKKNKNAQRTEKARKKIDEKRHPVRPTRPSLTVLSDSTPTVPQITAVLSHSTPPYCGTVQLPADSADGAVSPTDLKPVESQIDNQIKDSMSADADGGKNTTKRTIDQDLKDQVAIHLQGIGKEDAGTLTGLLAQEIAGVVRRRLKTKKLSARQYADLANTIVSFVWWYRKTNPGMNLPGLKKVDPAYVQWLNRDNPDAGKENKNGSSNTVEQKRASGGQSHRF